MSDTLAELLARPEGDVDVVRGALLVAREEYRDLDVDTYVGSVAGLVEEARGAVGPAGGGSRAAIESACGVFFGQMGFLGNEDEYYDARNSYLNDVIDRRLGIPITLAVLFVEVARGMGIEANGVGFPGRFLVGCQVGDETLHLDCYEGRVLQDRDFQQILNEIYGGKLSFRQRMLRPSSPQQILARIVTNLVGVHIHHRDVPRALRMTEVAMVVEPEASRPYRDRGFLHYEIEEWRRAVADLEEYLRRDPAAPDSPIARRHLQNARARIAHLS